MFKRSWAIVFAAVIVSSASLMAGDYSHLLEVVQKTWPERTKAMAICSLEANQFTLLELVENARDKGISLVILNIKDLRDMDKTVVSALSRRPGFCLIIDDDTVLGSKSSLIGRVASRAAMQGIPLVGLSPEPLKHGAVLAVGSAADAKVLVNFDMAKRLKLEMPEGAIDTK